jgi:hypothetical protein
MYLLGQVRRSDRTGVDVKSNKDERAVMVIAVFTDVLTLHESHVCAIRQLLGETGARASASNLCVTDHTVEVGDL